MKKILLLIATLLCAEASFAITLTPDEALGRLAGSSSQARKAAAAAHEASLLNTIETKSDLPAIYTFRQGSEMLLVAADDCAQPLLGICNISDDNDIEMPPQMQWWLQQYAQEIQAASGMSMPELPGLGIKLVNASADEKAPIAPLCSTRWNQDVPYNNMCPTISGQRCVTGCVATAMAQVMKYHNWPQKGQGSVSYSPSSNQSTTYSMDFNVTFDWANMLNSYDTSSSTAQKNAVALLMKACGYSVKMNYGTGASGAASVSVVPALINNFNYSEATRICDRQYYGLQDWQDMIYNNLKNVGPVYYSGRSNEGGHAFVCDGYSSDGYFHFNWGWGGYCDGYFLLTALNPSGQGIGGFAGGYNMDQEIILGAQPPKAGVTAPPFQLEQYKGLTASISSGRLILNGAWFSAGGMEYTATISVRFKSTTGNTTKYYNYSPFTFNSSTGVGDLPVILSDVSLTDGTYQVAVGTKSSSGTWTQALYPFNEAGYVLLTKKGASYTVTTPEAGSLSYSNGKMLTPAYLGTKMKLSFTAKNNSSYEVLQNMAPVLVLGTNIVAEGGAACLDLLPGESRDVELIFDIPSSGLSTTTTYTLYLYSPDDDTAYLSFGSVKPQSNPGASLTVNSFSLEGHPSAVNLSNLHFTSTVTCSSGYYADNLMVFITTQSWNTLDYTYSYEPLFLQAGQKGSSEFNIDFSQGTPGTSYLGLLAYYDAPNDNLEVIAQISFKGTLSGIEQVESQADSFSYDRATATLRYNAAATAVRAFTAMGVEIPVEPISKGTASLQNAPEGLMLISIVNPDGTVETHKIMK